MAKICIIIWLLFIGTFHLLAQQDRIEIPVRNNAETPYVASIGKLGFFLLIDQSRDEDGDRSVHLSRYDDKMNLKWETDILYSKNLPLRDSKVFEGKLYLFFHSSRQENFQVIIVDPLKSEPERLTIRHLKGFEYIEFLVFRDQFYMTGIMARQAAALKVSLTNREVLPIPLSYRGKNIQTTFLTRSRNSIFISVNFLDRKNKINILRELDPLTGKSINDLVITPDSNFDIQSAQASVLSGSETLAIGTYGLINSEYTQGFYISKFYGEREEYRKYYSFTDLTNFFGFLEQNVQDRIETKVNRKKSRGKDLRIRTRLLSHEIIKRDDEYVLVGEAYLPEYRTERVLDYSRGMRSYRYVQVFDGYRYTHAIVAVFDKEGNLKWDQSFGIDETKIFKLEERVSVCGSCENISLAYPSEGDVHISSIINGSLVNIRDEQIQTGGSREKVRQTSLGDSEYWYDNSFLFWGYQKISSKDSNDKNRRIFYINKVSF